jgi:lipid II:glycine glycyltransferase (peptidoglycan interpeptide bridge formation enzyme)
MGIFKSKTEKELDAVIERLKMNMANNYKDNARDNLKEFEALMKESEDSGKLKGKSLAKYEEILNLFREKMIGYSHKDQKPYWH